MTQLEQELLEALKMLYARSDINNIGLLTHSKVTAVIAKAEGK